MLECNNWRETSLVDRDGFKKNISNVVKEDNVRREPWITNVFVFMRAHDIQSSLVESVYAADDARCTRSLHHLNLADRRDRKDRRRPRDAEKGVM